MELQLTRPIVFFDIESTGLNISVDGIVELSFVKVFPGGEQRIKTWRVKPWDYIKKTQLPMHPSATAVNGIKDEDLKDCPKFSEIVDEVLEWLADSDLAGFNSAKFDLPLLAEEIERVRFYGHKDINVNLHEKIMVDVQTIFHYLEPRNLKAAYRFYCGGKDFENAHSAEADTLATYEVLKAQLDHYPEGTLKNDVKFLSDVGGRPKNIDYAGRLIFGENGEPTISFGKHKGRTAREVHEKDRSYYAWIDNGDFTLDTKRQFRLLDEYFEKEKQAARSKPLNGKDFEDAARELRAHFGCSPR